MEEMRTRINKTRAKAALRMKKITPITPITIPYTTISFR
jgi:hypothetical protein